MFQKLAETKRTYNFYLFFYLLFFKIGSILTFFHSKGNVPVLKHSLRILRNDLQINLSQRKTRVSQILNICKKYAITIYWSTLIGKVALEKFCFLLLLNMLVTKAFLYKTGTTIEILLLFRKLFGRDQYAFEFLWILF